MPARGLAVGGVSTGRPTTPGCCQCDQRGCRPRRPPPGSAVRIGVGASDCPRPPARLGASALLACRPSAGAGGGPMALHGLCQPGWEPQPAQPPPPRWLPAPRRSDPHRHDPPAAQRPRAARWTCMWLLVWSSRPASRPACPPGRPGARPPTRAGRLPPPRPTFWAPAGHPTRSPPPSPPPPNRSGRQRPELAAAGPAIPSRRVGNEGAPPSFCRAPSRPSPTQPPGSRSKPWSCGRRAGGGRVPVETPRRLCAGGGVAAATSAVVLHAADDRQHAGPLPADVAGVHPLRCDGDQSCPCPPPCIQAPIHAPSPPPLPPYGRLRPLPRPPQSLRRRRPARRNQLGRARPLLAAALPCRASAWPTGCVGV